MGNPGSRIAGDLSEQRIRKDFRVTSITIQPGPPQPASDIDLGVLSTVTNEGTIDGIGTGINLGNAGIVTNFGTIIGEAGDDGVDMGTTGILVNAAAGTITGQGAGISVGVTSIVINAGGITGTGSYGVNVGDGSSLTNIAPGGITGKVDGVDGGSSVTVFTTGTVTGNTLDGVYLGEGGTLTNAGTISGYKSGVAELSDSNLANFGVITGTSDDGVNLGTGSTITNNASGSISGTFAGVVEGANASLTNDGVIVGTRGRGVTLGAGGTITNDGTIIGNRTGISDGAGGVIVNSGMIASASRDGIYLSAGGTVTNAGTITGGDGTAVYLGGSGSNLLVVDPGAVFNGTVVGNAAATNTLELGAGSGTITNFDTNFTNINSIIADAGANWTLSFATQAEANAATLAFGNMPGVTYVTTETACFCAGTRITTSQGQVPVENLAIGDTVVTASGESRPVRWIGTRSFSETAAAGNLKILPIRIRSGAFADGIPHRDLLVSPDHAVFVDGKLICARQLVNGTTIRQETRRQAIHYFHVQLDGHAILLAEGLPAESYLNTGNHGMFANGAEPPRLHPDLMDSSGNHLREAASCAPFVWDADQVGPVWLRLAERAADLNQPFVPPERTTEPDLHLVSMGRKLHRVAAGIGRFAFLLPHPTAEVHLASRAGSPRDVTPWLEDGRHLGVRIARLVLRSEHDVRDIPIDHPDLTTGWWAVERDGSALRRWTDGNAVLPLPPFDGWAVLEVYLGGEMTYVLDAAPEASATRAAA
jgi:hypothetical protein